MRKPGVLTGCFCRNHRLTRAKVSFKASHQLPSDVKSSPVIFLEGFTVGRAPPLLPSLPQSPFCSWPPAFPVGLRLGIWAPHRMTSGPAMSSLEKWDRIASISTHKQTHHPKFPPAEAKKRKVRKRRGGGKNRGIWKMRGKENAFCCLPSPPPKAKPFSHRLSLRLFLRWGLDWPRCGEDTSFLRSLVGEGGPVPLPILVGRKKQTLIPGLPQSPSCPAGATSPKAALGRAQEASSHALPSQGLPKPVSQALQLPGQWFHSRAA